MPISDSFGRSWLVVPLLPPLGTCTEPSTLPKRYLPSTDHVRSAGAAGSMVRKSGETATSGASRCATASGGTSRSAIGIALSDGAVADDARRLSVLAEPAVSDTREC